VRGVKTKTMAHFHRSKPLSQFEANLLREKVQRLIKEKSFTEGNYVLASGKTSTYYLDMKPTLLSPEGANGIAEMVLHELEDVPVDYVGGLAMGAIPLTSAVIMLSGQYGSPLLGFFVRDKPKDHGTRKVIEGLAEGESLSGKKVVILEDVTTHGRSAMLAINAARDAGAEIVLVLSIVDRQEGAEDFFRTQSIPFKHLFRTGDFITAKSASN
jgi:orotate phosphoribosyltransferase